LCELPRKRGEAAGGNALKGDAHDGQTFQRHNGIAGTIRSAGLRRIGGSGRACAGFRSRDRRLARSGDGRDCEAKKNGHEMLPTDPGAARHPPPRAKWGTASLRGLCFEDHIVKSAVEAQHPGAKPERLNTRCQHTRWKGVGLYVVFIRIQPTQAA
jgi:hypothetical protein